MKAVSFELSGKTACFRKPDVNQFAYFTYNNIHKIALLGLLGAIVGYGGYTQLFNKNGNLKRGQLGYDDGYPEFYEKLKNLKISITPLAPYGYFSKKIQVFNNSAGYASKEDGGNLIVREQWLENPKWRIMVLDDGSDAYAKLKEYVLSGKCIFIPYLGKNDHPAKIGEVKEITLNHFIDDSKISSLFIEDMCEILSMPPRGELSYFFTEVSPVKLQEEYHFYKYENLVFTNHKVFHNSSDDIYSFEEENYFFM